MPAASLLREHPVNPLAFLLIPCLTEVHDKNGENEVNLLLEWYDDTSRGRINLWMMDTLLLFREIWTLWSDRHSISLSNTSVSYACVWAHSSLSRKVVRHIFLELIWQSGLPTNDLCFRFQYKYFSRQKWSKNCLSWLEQVHVWHLSGRLIIFPFAYFKTNGCLLWEVHNSNVVT